MAKKISADARRELLRAIGDRYRSGSKEERARILDEFVAVTGYHRKHSIRLLRAAPATTASTRRPRLRLYDAAVQEALVVLWEASDRVCGKRLKALLPLLLPALRTPRAPTPRGRCAREGTGSERLDHRSDAVGATRIGGGTAIEVRQASRSPSHPHPHVRRLERPASRLHGS